ncbi:hypothetical protein J2858_000950 [Neorhizobium galegae]|uniref:hypothetical protein n=1 Tax=Neorhizobium galegae TaxID=399 RepID=UPI001AE79C7A|nr:hypothetical protein [Neorhizobium galegae]MBP2548057.1 hypothetical protein [Neorhizobium galegae]
MTIAAGPLATASASDNWGKAPAFSEEGLTGSFWRLSSLDTGDINPFLVLAPEGRVGNFFDPAVEYWHVFDGHLCFVNADGQPSAIFTAAQTEDGRIVALGGRGTIGNTNALFILTATEHPQHPINATPKGMPRRAQFLVAAPKPRRPNLVVVPAGSGSLHGQWQEGIADNKRNWDICVGYYGTERPFLPAAVEYLAHLPQKRKFKLIYDLFYEDSPLWGYDRIWLPDDDLLISGEDINRMFHLSRRHELDLCQPALSTGEGSHPTHPITFQKPGGGVRHEPFIEIMCPLFSRRALKICIESFRDSESGYGLDHLWPSFLGRPESRMAILDQFGVKHTRPIATNYNLGVALAEQQAVFATYGFRLSPIPGVL